MALSLFLAKLIGLSLMLIAASLVINRKNVDLLFEVYSHPKVVFFTGILETVLGLSLVISHNIWALNFQGLITFIGWMLLIRGFYRTLAPSSVTKILEKMRKVQPLMVPLLIFVFFIGAYLAFKGFTG